MSFVDVSVGLNQRNGILVKYASVNDILVQVYILFLRLDFWSFKHFLLNISYMGNLSKIYAENVSNIVLCGLYNK